MQSNVGVMDGKISIPKKRDVFGRLERQKQLLLGFSKRYPYEYCN